MKYQDFTPTSGAVPHNIKDYTPFMLLQMPQAERFMLLQMPQAERILNINSIPTQMKQ
jgi:hypothetical protein